MMTELFKIIGFNLTSYKWGFLGEYVENEIIISVYYDKERGFVNMQAESKQLKNVILPSLDMHEPAELLPVLRNLCYIKTFLPKLHQKITEYHTPDA